MTIPNFPFDQNWPIHPSLITAHPGGGFVGGLRHAITPGGSGGLRHAITTPGSCGGS